MKKKLFLMIFSLFLLSGTLGSVPITTKAIGISPPTIEAPLVLRDIKQTKTIRVCRSPSEQGSVVVKVEKSGEFAHYIDAPSEFTILKGQNYTDYSFDINPVNAATGDYEVKLTFKVDPNAQLEMKEEDGVGAQVSIITGASAMVKFTITGEEVIDYEILGISGADTEVDRPAYIKLFINNLGNVEWKPDQIDFTFTDTIDSTNVTNTSIKDEEIPIIQPGEVNSETQLEISANLIEGSYTVAAKFYYKTEMIGEFVSSPFSVYPAGTLEQSGELISVDTDKTSYILGEKIKLNAIFKNTGNLPIDGVLITDINLGSDFIDMIRGEELSVGTSKEAVFSEIIELDKAGDYSLSSFVKYGNKKTDIQTVNLTVTAPENEFLAFLNSKFGLAGLILLIAVAAVVYKLRQSKRLLKNKKVKTRIKKPSVDK